MWLTAKPPPLSCPPVVDVSTPSHKNVIAKNYQQLWKDVASTSDEGVAVRTLTKIVLDKQGRTFILELECNGAELCMEILDRGIAEHKLKATEKQAFFVVLRRLAAIHGRLPESMTITERIDVLGHILASGGFADVRIGTYKGHLVAVKTMRVAKQDDLLKIRKQFCKEFIHWNTLAHPNILKSSGVRGDIDKGEFITISEWMAHGNIMEFIRKNSVNRLELLHGAAQGLSYLHDCAGLTHGDLKGANILMSNDSPPRACLADFGFMTMVLDPGQPMSCRAQLEGGTVMFMSPELLMPSKFGFKEAIPTLEADIFAFGLVIYQVLTVQGIRPSKPENASAIGFSDSLWSFVQRCWDGEMKLRPKVTEVVSQLERAAASWSGVMPPCAQVESVVLVSPVPVSDSMAHRGIFLRSSLSAVSDPASDSMAHCGIFLRSSPSVVSDPVSDSMAHCGIFLRSSPSIVSDPVSDSMAHGGIFLRSSPSAVSDPVSDSMAHCGIFLRSSPTVSQTIPTSYCSRHSFYQQSSWKSQCTGSPSVEAQEVVFSGSELAFEVRDPVVKDVRDPQNIHRTGGNRTRVPSIPAPQFQGRLPHNTPQPDLSSLPFSRALYPGTGLQALYLPEHPGRQPESQASTVSQEEQACDEMPVHRHLEQRYEPPPSQLSRGKQRKFKDLGRDLGQRFLRLVGIRKKSPPAKTAISFSSSRWRQLPSQSTARPGQSEGGSLMAQPPIRYTYDHDIDHAPCTLASRRITISF